MLRVLLSIGLALRIGLVAWMESSSNSTLLMDFMAGTDICLQEDFCTAIKEGMPSSLKALLGISPFSIGMFLAGKGQFVADIVDVICVYGRTNDRYLIDLMGGWGTSFTQLTALYPVI